MDRFASPQGLDPTRLERMFRAHRGVVWRLLRCRGLTADAAADATQEVFLVAAQRMADIQAGSERSFLIGTALRVAQAARRAGGRLRLDDQAADIPDERRARVDDHGSALDLVGKILSGIDPPLVEVFVLFEIAEYSSVEIAEMAGIPLGTVASRLRRARQAFSDAARRLELTARREQGQP